ncbi:MAG: alpha/beta fold hydrolase [Ardenticatenales bacterium]|nr:alpha/beta fold hydrolase [Ardenticatenales bacterium]
MSDKKGSSLVRGLLAGTLASVALAGFNYLSAEASDPPRPVLGGEFKRYPWRMGSIAYHVAGPEEGAPMLLVHGIHAAASNFEFRKQFVFFAAQGYRVYAPDLIGFGLSDHPLMSYSDEIYIALLADFTRDVISTPTHVIASTLSCSFVIAAAARYPERFAALVLVEPVGLEQLHRRLPVLSDLFYTFVKTPVIGEGFFNLLTSPPSIRYFLRKQGYRDSENVTDELVDYHFQIAHQPNARYAPGAFLSGFLNRDIRHEWSSLKNRILLIWGYQGTTVPVQRGTEFLRVNPRAVVNGYDANLLPHDEQAEKFNHDTLEWLQGRRKD